MSLLKSFSSDVTFSSKVLLTGRSAGFVTSLFSSCDLGLEGTGAEFEETSRVEKFGLAFVGLLGTLPLLVRDSRASKGLNPKKKQCRIRNQSHDEKFSLYELTPNFSITYLEHQHYNT